MSKYQVFVILVFQEQTKYHREVIVSHRGETLTFFGGGEPTLEKMGGTHFVQEWGDMTGITPKWAC